MYIYTYTYIYKVILYHMIFPACEYPELFAMCIAQGRAGAW